MAKKQFIRHLEFYGFPDQNGYSSVINGGDVDIDDIIKKNKEQDEEIQDLEGEKADKKDLDELSGKVETMIAAHLLMVLMMLSVVFRISMIGLRT